MRPSVLAICAAAAVAAAGVAVASSIGTSVVKPATATSAATAVVGSTARTWTTPAGTLAATALDLSGSGPASRPTGRNPFGVMLPSRLARSSQGMQVTKALGAIYYRPSSVFLDEWKGTCPECVI